MRKQIEFKMLLNIRQAENRDRDQWNALFEAYCGSGGETQTSSMRDRVWRWIHDKSAQTVCFVAEDDQGEVVGFVHFRSYERPMSATKGVFIDDLFVAPSARGRGVVDRLIEAVGKYAKEQGFDVVRWMTSETNYRARSVYDRHATRSNWVTYQLST